MNWPLFCLLAFLTLGMGFVVYIIAADRQRFLTRFDLHQWRENYYLRALPNFLQALHDNHFSTAWPLHCNALSAAFFRFRARGLLGRKSGKLRRAFLQQHITLFALLENLRPYLRDYFLHEQERIVGMCCADMEDTADRERLIAYLESLREHRAAFQRSLTSFDRQIMVQMLDRHLIPTLRRAHAIFQEHGFSLLQDFSNIRKWQDLSGPELVQELPRLPVLARPRDRARPRHNTQNV